MPDEEGCIYMKRLAYVALGAALGATATFGFLPAASGAGEAVTSIYHQLDLFSEAFETVRAKYVEPVKDSDLINNAIEGMVTSLDPHSDYMTAKQLADFQVQATGQFGGVGIEIQMEDGLLKVISPIDDTPAAKAGIKAGDYIAAVDGAAIQGLGMDKALEKMRGKPGSKVTLTILREGAKKPFDVTMTRAIIHVERVKWHAEKNIGYIRLTGFNEATDKDLEKAVKDLQKKIGERNIRGYVLDLRNNPGGLFDQAIAVASDFIKSGEVVSTRGREADETRRYNAKAGDITGGKKLVVLINGGSASSSEIVAGALQDHKRAVLMGMKSFGKGSVQSVIPLSSGGAIKITTARYYTPSGRSIQAEGIVPDIAVAQGNESELTRLERPSEADLPGHLKNPVKAKEKTVTILTPAKGKTYKDFQLEYALDYLRGTHTVEVTKKTQSISGN